MSLMTEAVAAPPLRHSSHRVLAAIEALRAEGVPVSVATVHARLNDRSRNSVGRAMRKLARRGLCPAPHEVRSPRRQKTVKPCAKCGNPAGRIASSSTHHRPARLNPPPDSGIPGKICAGCYDELRRQARTRRLNGRPAPTSAEPCGKCGTPGGYCRPGTTRPVRYRQPFDASCTERICHGCYVADRERMVRAAIAEGRSVGGGRRFDGSGEPLHDWRVEVMKVREAIGLPVVAEERPEPVADVDWAAARRAECRRCVREYREVWGRLRMIRLTREAC